MNSGCGVGTCGHGESGDTVDGDGGLGTDLGTDVHAAKGVVDSAEHGHDVSSKRTGGGESGCTECAGGYADVCRISCLCRSGGSE